MDRRLILQSEGRLTREGETRGEGLAPNNKGTNQTLARPVDQLAEEGKCLACRKKP